MRNKSLLLLHILSALLVLSVNGNVYETEDAVIIEGMYEYEYLRIYFKKWQDLHTKCRLKKVVLRLICILNVCKRILNSI